jgi:hypothetical protein
MTAHTYHDLDGTEATLDVPDGFAAPDGIAMNRDGGGLLVLFSHDEFVVSAYTKPSPPPPQALIEQTAPPSQPPT